MFGLSNFFTTAHAENYTIEKIINGIDANVIFMRHALAPGIGDPNNFKIGDCSTQRNLNETGIAQAVLIGKQLKKNSIQFNKIYSSQWCRCLETAELLKLGEVIPESSLNSGFKGIFNKEKSLSTLRNILEALNNENEPILMVTHYGTISALTGINVDSGGVVAYDVNTKRSIKISLK